jgi:PAS domain S-box-containing protein
VRALTDELARTRTALEESEDRFSLLMSNIPGAIYRRALDPDMTIGLVSDAIDEITGYTARSLTDNKVRSYASIVHPDDLAGVAEATHAAIDAGRHYGLAYRIVRADGSEAWVGDRGQAVRDRDALWLYGTLSDISERKRLEAANARMVLELSVTQKLEAVGQLAAGIAHEINTPIQFIGDSVVFLKDSFEDIERLLAVYREVCATATADGAPGAEALRAQLLAAEEAADLSYLEERLPAAFTRTLDGIERVASIVRAMKEFAHRQTEQGPSDLNQALATTLIVARNEYKYIADVETEFGELPLVICNLSDLNQVFLNLIVNAAHAIEDAQAPGRDRGTIRIATACDDETATVTISDNGCGIADEITTRVFDPFFTTKAVGRGSGQGLAIARAVIAKHDGVLSFDTRHGIGTTFTIRLPLAGTQVAPA